MKTKTTILIMTILTSLTSWGQDSVKVSFHYDYPLDYTEEYYTYFNNLNYKTGTYTYTELGYPPHFTITGFYKNNQKDSIWIKTKSMIHEDTVFVGAYENDKRIGQWKFFNTFGGPAFESHQELIQIYNYTSQELVFPKRKPADAAMVIVGTDTVKTKLDKAPICIGGLQTLFNELYANIKYPALAKENGIQGTIYIQFLIDTTGKMRNIKALNKIGYDLEESALKAFLGLDFDWLPGELDRKKVDVVYALPVAFKLN